MTRFLFCWFLLFGLSSADVHGQDQQKTTKRKKEVLTINAVVDLERKEGGKLYFANLKLKNLPAGQTARLNVVLKNSFDEIVKFSGVSNKCKCKRFKKQSAEIRPGGEGEISFDLSIPSRHKQKNVETSITLVNKGVSVLKLNINYELDGLLAFGQLMSIVRFSDVADKEKEIEIPLLVTAPLDWQKVELKTSENLSGVNATIQFEDGSPVVMARIPVSVLEQGNVRGELYVSNPDGWESDTFMLSVKDTRRHEISPQVLVFKNTGNGTLRATSIIKIAGFSNADESKPKIKAYIGQQELNLSMKLLGNSTYRVELLTAQPINGDDEDLQLKWKIFNGNSDTEMTSEIVFEKS